MCRWEVRGVGYVDPQLVRGTAVTNATAEGAVVIGTWEPNEITAVVLALMASGFELVSVRRLGSALGSVALGSG